MGFGHVDLSMPSYAGAYRLARMMASTWDRAGADVLFSRLLWHVPADQGGFIGLTDAQLADRIRRDQRLSSKAVYDAQYNPGEWPHG